MLDGLADVVGRFLTVVRSHPFAPTIMELDKDLNPNQRNRSWKRSHVLRILSSLLLSDAGSGACKHPLMEVAVHDVQTLRPGIQGQRLMSWTARVSQSSTELEGTVKADDIDGMDLAMSVDLLKKVWVSLRGLPDDICLRLTLQNTDFQDLRNPNV